MIEGQTRAIIVDHHVSKLPDALRAARALQGIPFADIHGPGQAPGLADAGAGVEIDHRQVVTEEPGQLGGHPVPRRLSIKT